MTQKEIELLLSWFVNEEIRLSNDVSQLQQNIRFRPIDSVDCLELILATNRLQNFRDFMRVTRRLLSL